MFRIPLDHVYPKTLAGCVPEQAVGPEEAQAGLGSDGHYDESTHEYLLFAHTR